ncbi:hypothetical protein PAMP_023456 [Pampus punctatissimus]
MSIFHVNRTVKWLDGGKNLRVGQMDPLQPIRVLEDAMQLIPMVTQMKGRAICTSSCSFSVPIFSCGNVLHCPELLKGIWRPREMASSFVEDVSQRRTTSRAEWGITVLEEHQK